MFCSETNTESKSEVIEDLSEEELTMEQEVEAENSADEDNEEDIEETPQNMGIILGLLNQLICVLSFLFISLPLGMALHSNFSHLQFNHLSLIACGLSAIWIFRGSYEEITDVEDEEHPQTVDVDESEGEDCRGNLTS
jgi:hypothetical protein